MARILRNQLVEGNTHSATETSNIRGIWGQVAGPILTAALNRTTALTRQATVLSCLSVSHVLTVTVPFLNNRLNGCVRAVVLLRKVFVLYLTELQRITTRDQLTKLVNQHIFSLRSWFRSRTSPTPSTIVTSHTSLAQVSPRVSFPAGSSTTRACRQT